MIFCPIVKKDYEWLNTIHNGDYEVFRSFDGAPRKMTWQPIVVRCVRADSQQKQLFSDFPWLGGVLVFRKKAMEVLRSILEQNGEILPLITEDGAELFVHNTQVLQNALDEENSTIVRFPGSTRIMRIKKIAFNDSVVRGLDMFRLPLRSSETYVSEKFVEQVSQHSLVGLDFNKVWELNS